MQLQLNEESINSFPSYNWRGHSTFRNWISCWSHNSESGIGQLLLLSFTARTLSDSYIAAQHRQSAASVMDVFTHERHLKLTYIYVFSVSSAASIRLSKMEVNAFHWLQAILMLSCSSKWVKTHRRFTIIISQVA